MGGRCGALAVVALATATLWAADVQIQDPNLEAVVRETLGKFDGPLTDADMAELVFLDARRRGIATLAGFTGAVNLEEWSLAFNDIADATLPADLLHLTLLELRGNPLERLTVAAPLPALAQLLAAECLLTDLGFLGSLPQLRFLDLRYNDLPAFEPPGPLPELEHLDLGFNRVRDLGFLATLPKLKELLLDDNGLTAFPLAEPRPDLTFLSLTVNRFSDLTFLERLPNLETLDLASNLAAEYSFPTGLTRLAWLNLGENRLTNVTFAPDTTNLVSLYLDDNRFATMPSLEPLRGLGVLDLAMNQLSEIVLPHTVTQLFHVDARFNPLATVALPDVLATNRLSPWVADLTAQGVAVHVYPVVPTLAPLTWNDGTFQSGLLGPPGVHRLEATADLLEWQTVQRLTNRLGTVTFSVPPVGPYRFFRTVLP